MSIEHSIDQKEMGPDQSIQKFLSERHVFLKDHYLAPDGSNEACFLVALDVAEVLILNGKQVDLVTVTAKMRQSSGFISGIGLNPVQYKNKTDWGGHVVAVSDDRVYDPIYGRPIRVSDYGKEVFGTELDMRVILNGDEVKRAINSVNASKQLA